MCKRVQTCSRQRKNCYQFNSKHLLISDVISNYRVFFSRYFEQVFYEVFFCLKIFVSLFCSSGLLYFFTRVTSQQCSRPRVMWDSSRSWNTWKANLQQFFATVSGLHQAAVLEKFNENNLAKVSFLKLLTKENLLFCCH